MSKHFEMKSKSNHFANLWLFIKGGYFVAGIIAFCLCVHLWPADGLKSVNASYQVASAGPAIMPCTLAELK